MIVDFQAHNNAILDISWGDEFRLATGSGDQTVRVWQIRETGDVEPLNHFKDIGRSVKCVEFLHANILAAGTRPAGERANALMLWDIRDPVEKPFLQIEGAHTHYAPNATKKNSKNTFSSSITAIQFQDERKLVSVSDNDGLVKVWDLRKSYDRFKGTPQPMHVIAYPGKSNHRGYTSLAFNSSKSHIYASCRDNHIYCYDLASYSDHPLRSYGGYKNDNKFYIRASLSYDDKYLACGSSDESAYIWSTSPMAPNLPESNVTAPIYKLTGHDAEVTCVDWSRDTYKLATCDDNMKHWIWRIEPNLDSEEVSGQVEDLSEQFCWPEKFVTDSKITEKLSHLTKLQTPKKARNFDEDDIRSPDAKRQCIRSPLKSLQSTPQKLSSFPCSPRKMTVTPRKSARKLALAAFPSFIKDGTSPHQPCTSTKKNTPLRKEWQFLQKLKITKRSSSSEDSKENTKKKTLPKTKRTRVKKSLNMNI